MIRSFFSILKKPGGYRIFLGGTLVILLTLVTINGTHWTKFKPDEMDFEHPLVPPKSNWLTRLTTTAEGRKSLMESHQTPSSVPTASRSQSPDESDELLGALKDERSAASEAQSSASAAASVAAFG